MVPPSHIPVFPAPCRSGAGEGHAQVCAEAAEGHFGGDAARLPGEERRVAAAEGEPGAGQGPPAAGDGRGRRAATRPRGYREDPPQVPHHAQDVLAREEGGAATARLQAHLHHHGGPLR